MVYLSEIKCTKYIIIIIKHILFAEILIKTKFYKLTCSYYFSWITCQLDELNESPKHIPLFQKSNLLKNISCSIIYVFIFKDFLKMFLLPHIIEMTGRYCLKS